MKWIDYREKLGLGFSDNEKYEKLINKINIYLTDLNIAFTPHKMALYVRGDDSFLSYFIAVGETPPHLNFCLPSVCSSIINGVSIAEVVSKYVAFLNVASQYISEPSVVEGLKRTFLAFLSDLNIPYSVKEDDDGIFVFPKGIPEFDDALVSQPLSWLSQYPLAEKAWTKALKDYSEATEKNASAVADMFRKALESFFQEFFGGSKSLDNYKTKYGAYLKEQGVPKEISGNLETLLQAYTNYNNNYAKHRDATSDKVLEYLMYQTGNIIRLLITLKQEDETDAD